MFYLTERKDVKQCLVGDVVMTLCDWPQARAGSKGKVIEITDTFLKVEWQNKMPDSRMHEKSIYTFLNNHYLQQYLRFATTNHPEDDPTVYNEDLF